MEVAAGSFERIHPCRYMTFTFPNPHPNSPPRYADPLHVAVLDSPFPGNDHRQIAAMLVPIGRESDWIFSTFEGHLDLLLSSPSHQRLLLIGNAPETIPPPIYHRAHDHAQADDSFEQSLMLLLYALSPRSAFSSGSPPHVPFLSYDDGVVRSVVVEVVKGIVAGDMLVEDVQLEGEDMMRRRLRFRRMPNILQSQIPVIQSSGVPNSPAIDAGSLLLQPYLPHMVAGLSLAAPLFEERMVCDANGRVICLGVGGGCLPMFLRLQLELDVLGVESDEAVLNVAMRHFGFRVSDALAVCVGDGIELMRCLAGEARWSDGWRHRLGKWSDNVGEVDAVMVDLDSCSCMNAVVAPPDEFVRRDVVTGVRTVLRQGGILVINVLPLEESHYLELVDLLHEVFYEIYEIQIRNEENFVLVATTLPDVGSNGRRNRDGIFRRKLENLIGLHLLNSVKKKVKGKEELTEQVKKHTNLEQNSAC